MITRDPATERQVQAADPAFSTWLAANAGSGKTRVLTDRVARLLLNEVSPLHILCLTYTKAAASEMQNRLFQRLGSWAMLNQADLHDALTKLGVPDPISEEDLRRARRLFARAIETPGGLKIQTIHSFCASLLRRFPLEAGVSQQFKEMDERTANILRAEIVDEISDGPDSGVVDQIARHYTGDDFGKLTATVCRFQSLLSVMPDDHTLRARFGVPSGLREDDIIDAVFTPDTARLIVAILPALEGGSSTDVKNAKALSAVNWKSPDLRDLEKLERISLFGASAKAAFTAKSGSFPTKATRLALGSALEPLIALMICVETARNQRVSLSAYQKTAALYHFAEVFLPTYKARKQRSGLLDFDDLIILAARLLTDSRMAQWVLFRLDGGIDHILVDEAQDTNPAQWDVIRSLTQEFTAGMGSRQNTERSLFVVGDKKQSIYSFQGADPDAFDRMCAHFKTRLTTPFQDLLLEYSFRSADSILRLVDETFRPENGHSLDDQILHRAFKSDMPGRVDLWPIEPKTDDTEDRAWHDPVDKASANHHTVRLGAMIARNIRNMLDIGAIPEEIGHSGAFRMRKIRPGDILILVQSRQQLFGEIIRACKNQHLPIAGADVLRVGAELAVKDLTALLSFLSTPEDDLSLATALRSPLFGWSEQQIFDLAHNRGEHTFLFEALRKQNDAYSETLTVLEDLRNSTDFLRPYELLEHILTRHKGRHNLLKRLRHEAEEGIDALLALAMDYEKSEVPSLTGFLAWLASEEVSVKRQVDRADDRIRVMTVHGAKGLEAPIVILPDTVAGKKAVRDEFIADGNGGLLWKTPRDSSPPIVTLAHDRLEATQAAERLRLLYVAMTRAEKWLIVCGAGELPKTGDPWYQTVATGMKKTGAEMFTFSGGVGLRLENGTWGEPTESEDSNPDKLVSKLPVWAYTDAPTPPRAVQTLSPSDLGGAKFLTGMGGDQNEGNAMRHGRQIHRLLEHLPTCPRKNWNAFSQALLQDSDDAAAPDEIAALLDEACTVLLASDLQFLFNETALTEVDISASLPILDGARIHGTIDRLLVENDRVLAVDFKTNLGIPPTPQQIPLGILRQMGAYGAALSQIYPDRPIELAILWTRNAGLMYLPQDIVTAALQAIAKP